MSIDFKWKDEYSVQVREIDDQHKKLIGLIHQLFEAMNAGTAREELGDILHGLIEYSDYHFATEEKYFRKFDYKQTDAHIKQHEAFTKKIKDLYSQYEGKEIELSFDLINFLEDWLIGHLMHEDQKYVDCFTSHGLK